MSKRHLLMCAVNVGLISCWIAACAAADDAKTQSASPPQPVLRSGFDRFTRSVTTSSPEAQRWFDQGLQLLYGFDHVAAISAFTQATKQDPQCVMAWWGLAYAHGPSIDDPKMGESESNAAYQAVQEGLKHIDHAEPVEQALIVSLSKRYVWPAPEDRRPLDEAFATAMRQAWMEHPTDAEIGAAYADALMILHPRQYWTSDGRPIGETETVIMILEATLAETPSHPGANHYYVLAVEGSDDPMRAWRSSSLMQELVPGSGHLTHMASHIFQRMGHYPRAADSNQRAVEADRAMYTESKPSDAYRAQMIHHEAALADAAMMEARFETAIGASRRIEALADSAFLRSHLKRVDGLSATRFQVLARFGRWNDILNEPEVSADRLVSRALRHYARGSAFSSMGRLDDARAELRAFDEAAKLIDADWLIGMHLSADVLPIARKTLEGQILWVEGKQTEAFETLKQAATLEDQIIFASPRGWMTPVRHILGAMLLQAGMPHEAETVYREDLKQHPHNGWSMLGLRDALVTQGKRDEAQQLSLNIPRAWGRADATATASWWLGTQPE